MSSSKAYFRHIGRLLKRTSLEMRRVISQPMPDPPDNIDSSHPLKPPTDSDDFLSDWWIDPPQTEFSLSDELLKGMESIVTCRQCTFAILSRLLPEDPRQCQKYQILNRIQEVETRAVVFLTLPPTNTGGWEDVEMVDRVNSIFTRFLEDAEVCLADANDLLKGKTVQKAPKAAQSTPPLPPKSDLPKDLLISGFCQNDALAINNTTNNSLFHLLSNPDLRVATSLVKMIIGSACSQITGSDPEHCLNRLNYLLAFFEGAPVRPPGAAAEVFRLPQDMGMAFAWHCLLNAALAQAERQFAFSLHSVLPFAAVLATLLARYPEYIPNFLARMASACPVLTSYVDDSATTFASLDVELDEGVLQCWRGISRLFAAVLLARPPPGFTQRPEHLNPKLLWITIAGIARHEGKLDITSEVLHGLIEVGGYVLLQLYQRQARRLFKSLIDAVGDSQSVSQLALITCLEQLLDPTTATENGHGVLLDDFWN
ncbi:nucleoporin GLE1 [Echinococcus multilocularis]|uniref:GLE1 RNA export mediator n=1 Tax=Echinococcus multilocularis TaxID=6211 RepID=A0A068Y683_ECHMU|nr:nucleoporin GLE1 [Echinococcus multilocularis]